MSQEKKYTAPEIGLDAFTCPHCGVFADQKFTPRCNPATHLFSRPETLLNENAYIFGSCRRCLRMTLWRDNKMVYPIGGPASDPSEDMPADVMAIYHEANKIAGISPRAAAGLLRMAVERLIRGHLLPDEDKDSTLYALIGILVKSGLDISIQQSLDVVRIIGNEALHSGQIAIDDDPEVVATLFMLLNYIVDDRITRPKTVSKIYNKLPSGKLQGIKDRDK